MIKKFTTIRMFTCFMPFKNVIGIERIHRHGEIKITSNGYLALIIFKKSRIKEKLFLRISRIGLATLVKSDKKLFSKKFICFYTIMTNFGQNA